MAPDAVISSVSDKSDFKKLVYMLASKAVQIIVESRKGEKLEVPKPISQSDSGWFNLNIPDCALVNQATQDALPADNVLETFQSKLHVEISVKTEDGDELVLELWTFSLDENQFDPTLKSLNTVYVHMGILLKSLIAITRLTPAYHISRKQKTDAFTINHQIYSGEPKNKLLGSSVKTIQVGMVRTPRGGIRLSVSYRTDLFIDPTSRDRSHLLLLKSDHFELSPKHIVYDSKKKKEHRKQKPVLDLNKPLRLAAFVDELLIQKITTELFEKYPLPKISYQPDFKPEKLDSKSTQKLDTSSFTSKSPTSFEMPSPPKLFPGYRSEGDPPLRLLYFPFAHRHPLRELAEFYRNFFNAPHLKFTGKFTSFTFEFTSCTSIEGPMVFDMSMELDKWDNSVQEFDDLVADMCKAPEWSGSGS